MKLGLQSAILDGMSFEEVVDFAAEHNFKSIEFMCWPVGKAERKYAGVTHIDVSDFTKEKADYINEYCADKGVEISALGYYPNALCPDEEEAQIYIDHIMKVIDAAAILGLDTVCTFIGNNWHKNVDDNWPRLIQVWTPILEHAKSKNIKIGIENCAMFFTDDEWPAGKNIAYSPKIWRRLFAEFDGYELGLNYDPSHLVWMQMDYEKPWGEFRDRMYHAHAKDVTVHQEKLDEVGTMANPLEYHTPRIPGRGDIDWKKYISTMKMAGFDGAICIEVEDADYEDSLASRKQSLIDSANHLRPFIEG
ncbi:sugar phosphate isomerase/epimerase family protein [Pseudemcibacter aquimaris]|uniref:sugar phosphate isomerase/epimerase family protein n=1 Tax=Pseudemcibacter aquimaris TaxID=2857064 RepID=UPI0020116F49|nr:sugar phosphate isomerase/epimerase [Pseudemcibacter aquimaris]MCC3862567.1 sugar phosphate isomerase/epimerase [Pseudemcibacter aquimaris]WDU57915.1 sugar phosphate isomerase/epimerase [Pseudemcibacter aquimaris]